MNALSVLNSKEKMSSKEIAELMGKRHDNVLRDIKSLVDQGAIHLLSFEEVFREVPGANSALRKMPMYLLDFEATMTLITGYDAMRRAAVIKRWIELEGKLAEQSVKELPPPVKESSPFAIEELDVWDEFQNAFDKMKKSYDVMHAEKNDFYFKTLVLKGKLDDLKPAKLLFDNLTAKGRNFSVTEVAKFIGVAPRSVLYPHLVSWHWVYKSEGRYFPNSAVIAHGFLGAHRNRVMVTVRGLKILMNKLINGKFTGIPAITDALTQLEIDNGTRS